MWKADFFWKDLMLPKIEGRRSRGWQSMRWLDGITDWIDMNLGEFWQLVMNREASRTVVHGVPKSWTWLSDWPELNWTDTQDWPDLWRCSLLTYKATTGWQFQGLQWQQFQLGPRHYSFMIFHVALVLFQFIIDGYRMGAPTLGCRVLALSPGKMMPKSFLIRDLFTYKWKPPVMDFTLWIFGQNCAHLKTICGGGRTMLLSLWSRHLCFQAGGWRGLSAGLTLSDICHTSYTCFPPCLPSPHMTYL